MNAPRPMTVREKTKANQNFANDPLIGKVIGGHYEVIECVGKGGMSSVYKVRHQLINQLRAIKILLPHRDAASDFLLRFQLEATAASRMDHRHIVRIHEFVSPEDTAPYLVMDFVDGDELGHEIDHLGRIPYKRALYIFFQLLEAMGHTHSRGVIHRDLKPDNIILIRDPIQGPDYVKLIDFGIAKLTAADKMQPQGLTPTGEVFGSPQYMSPEQCAGLPMDVRSEIYSLGCMLYEMLSGRAPLLGKSVLETLNMQAHTPATPLAQLVIDPPVVVPKALDDILMKCLAKKPDDRFQTTEELAEALAKIQSPDTKPDDHPGSRDSLNTKKKSSSGKKFSEIAPIVVSMAVLGFILGFGLSKLIDPIGGGTKDNGQNKAAAKAVATDPTAQGVDEAELNRWHGFYDNGQKGLDTGDLDAAKLQLDQALTIANSLNDGQKHAVATSSDLESLAVIKQFKNTKGPDLTSAVALSSDYPNHPWETKIEAVTAALKAAPTAAIDQKQVFKSILALLEDPTKGNLSNLQPILDLAASQALKYENLSPREKLRLTLAIAAAYEQQGYSHEALALMQDSQTTLETLGTFDPLTARFYLLQGSLCARERDLPQATVLLTKAEEIYKENPQEHQVETLVLALVRSDMAREAMDFNLSLDTASRALATAKEWHGDEGGRLEGLKNELLIRCATLDTPHYLEAANKSAPKVLENEEQRVPKQIRQLIAALSSVEAINMVNGNAKAGSTRPLLWRAMALAYASGHLADASHFLKALELSL